MKKYIAIVPLAVLSTSIYAKVNLDESKSELILSNDQITLKIDKKTANVKDVRINGKQNLVGTITALNKNPKDVKTFYLDYHTGVSGGGRGFKPRYYEVVENNSDAVHVKFIEGRSQELVLEYHYILREGVSGVYSYVVAQNVRHEPVKIAELRNVYRFDARIMDSVFNGTIQGKVPLYAELDKQKKLQDETWQFSDGTVYSKYDYAGYMRDSHVWGVMGGGYGAWLISASHDYFPGDPQMQELLVHQDGIVLNYMTGAHLGTPDMIAPRDWEKLYGPWLVYLNEGNNDEVLADAKAQAEIQTSQWPYQWMKDSRYQTQRGTLSGKVDFQDPVEVVLTSATGEEFDVATLGYNYSTTVDANGEYHIANINPGKYVLAAYALSGSQTGTLIQQNVEIGKASKTVNLAIADEARNVVWQIGKANRRATGFKFSDEKRNFKWFESIPANLTYTIGESSPDSDWYYAQTKTGKWTIKFNMDAIEDKTLNISIAAASNSGMNHPTTPKLAVVLNGNKIATLIYDNDKAVYRGALQSGRYHNELINVSKENLKSGENELVLDLEGGAFVYDTILLF